MKYLKYIGIIGAIALMFYAKNKIDTRNKINKQALDSIEDAEPAPVAAKR